MATLAPQRVRSARLRVALGNDAVAIGVLAVFSFALAIVTWQTWGDLGKDTGYDVVAGARLADGEIPYVDYVYYYGPLAPALAAVSHLLVGGGMTAALVLGFALAAAVLVAVYGLARTLLEPLGALLAAGVAAPIVFAPNNFSFVLPHTYSAPLGVLLTLTFLIGVARYSVSGRTSWLLAAGASAGLVALTRPEFELAVVVAAAVWLLLRARARLGGLREATLFAGPALLIPAAVYGGFLLALSPRELLFENLYPVDALDAAGTELLRISAPFTASSFVELAGRLALYAVGAAALVLVGRALTRSRRATRVLLPLVVLGGTLVAAASILNPEALRHGLQYAYGWIPAGALVAAGVLLWRVRRRDGGWTGTAQVELVAVLVLAILAAKTYAAFFAYASSPQKAVYVVPLAAVFIARLHLRELAVSRPAYSLGACWLAFLALSGAGLTAKDSREESARVGGPGGTIAELPGEAGSYDEAISWILRTTEPGDAILLAPQMTTLYTLTEREGALPNIDLLPGALPKEADQRAAIARLEEAQVQLAVIDRREFPEYGHTFFGGSFDRVLADWIHGRFRRVATIGDDRGARTLDVWVRNT